jgi:hypothetical protein
MNVSYVTASRPASATVARRSPVVELCYAEAAVAGTALDRYTGCLNIQTSRQTEGTGSNDAPACLYIQTTDAALKRREARRPMGKLNARWRLDWIA